MTKNQPINIGAVVTVLAMMLMSSVPAAVAEPEDRSSTEVQGLPQPETISQIVAENCMAQLTAYRTVAETPMARTAAVAYADCAVSVIDRSGILQPLLDACRAFVASDKADCLARIVLDHGIGEQTAALAEACAMLGNNLSGFCRDLLKLEFYDCANAARCLVWVESFTKISDVDDDSYPCTGARVGMEGEATVDGHVINLGVFVAWKNKIRANVRASVSWEASCEVLGEVLASGGGGFLRAVRATRDNTEAYKLCDYDGLTELECEGVHSSPEAFVEDGTYDAEKGEGDRPLAQLTAKIVPNFNVENTFQGSFRNIEMFNPQAVFPVKAERNLNVVYEGGLAAAADVNAEGPEL